MNLQYTQMTHCRNVIMSAMASQVTGVSIVYSTASSGIGQIKHQTLRHWPFVRGIHRWPVNFPHKGPVTRKMFPLNNVIMNTVRVLLVRWDHNQGFSLSRHEKWYKYIRLLNISRPKQSDRYITDVILKCVLLFSWTKVFEFALKCHWNVLLRIGYKLSWVQVVLGSTLCP